MIHDEGFNTFLHSPEERSDESRKSCQISERLFVLGTKRWATAMRLVMFNDQHFIHVQLFFYLSAHVSRHIDLVRKFRNIHFKSSLHLIQVFLVRFTANKRNRNTFGTETTRTTDTVQELISVVGEVIVDHNVHSLNINTTAKQIRRDQDTSFEVLEGFVFGNTFLLFHSSMDTNGRKVTFR